MSGIWWTKMEHKEDFCEHFCEMSDKEIVADIRKSINSFLKQRADGADFGAKMVKKALDRITSKHDSAVANGSLGGRATAAKNNSPQDAPNGNAGVDMHDAGNGAASKSPTSCDQFTADASTREGEDEHDHRGNTGTLESSTSANNYGDAATREGAEVVNSRESGAAVPTTVSRNMRRVPQNEAPAHGFSGGRTAQGTLSRSPEAAAQSGKDSAKTRDTREDSRGRYAPPSCSPEDGIPAETAPSHGGSVASLEARQVQARESQGRTDGSSVRGMAKVAQPSVRSRASFRNKEDFIRWAIDDGLDPVDAGECWEATEERGGKDADGNTVKNMKAFARQWCRTRANNRRTA